MLSSFLADRAVVSLTSLSDSPGSSPLVAAVSWLQGTLLGTIAIAVAIIAVSWVGLLMLMGRIEIRHGLTVIAGCFILFGASAIASGIQSFAGRSGAEAAYAAPPIGPAPVPPPARPRNADPYAGAALPTR